MSFKNAKIGKINCRVMRISFTGEHSYEINIQSNYGKSVWEKCMEAGKDFNITPYGTETMHLHEMGVDIIQNCEVKGIKRNGDVVEGLETTKGFIKTKKIGVVAAGHSSVIANMAGLKSGVINATFEPLNINTYNIDY